MNYEQKNKEIVRHVYEATAAGDTNAFSVMHEDFEEMVPPILPWGGVHSGVPVFMTKVLPMVAKAIDFPSLRLVSLSADGDRVAALSTGNTTTGKELWVSEHWKLRDGKVMSIMVFYHDTTPLIAAYESNMRA